MKDFFSKCDQEIFNGKRFFMCAVPKSINKSINWPVRKSITLFKRNILIVFMHCFT